jgi:putative thiamine transport system permease protein
VLVVPVLVGLWATITPAMAPFPGQEHNAFNALWAWNGLWPASWISVLTGFCATVIALALTAALFALFEDHKIFTVFLRLLTPFLAIPHAAAALALAFILAPSGWVMRAIVSVFNSLNMPISQTPPDIISMNDPWGLALMFGLVVKEVPFLVLMTLAAWAQCDAPRRRLTASTLGYGRAAGFWLTIWPVLYPQLRLPIFAVLAYAMTSVEMAMILGPSLPPTLAVQITKWMALPDPQFQKMAAAAALLQLVLVAGVLLLWRIIEIVTAAISRARFQSGGRGLGLDLPIKILSAIFGVLGFGCLFFGLISLGLWSCTGLWPYPDFLPQTYTARSWASAKEPLLHATNNTLILASVSTLCATALALAVLQTEYLQQKKYRAQWIIYLPLLLPQITFLPGLYHLALITGVAGNILTVAFAHFIFVLPYVALTLAPAFRAWDTRFALVAAAMGVTNDRVFWRLRLPMLLRPILVAAAVGFAVSVAQYLPSQLIGAGQIETLTTEAVALSSGGNRRLIGTYGLAQSLLPAIAFGLAMIIPSILYRNRRALRAPK